MDRNGKERKEVKREGGKESDMGKRSKVERKYVLSIIKLIVSLYVLTDWYVDQCETNSPNEATTPTNLISY